MLSKKDNPFMSRHSLNEIVSFHLPLNLSKVVASYLVYWEWSRVNNENLGFGKSITLEKCMAPAVKVLFRKSLTSKDANGLSDQIGDVLWDGLEERWNTDEVLLRDKFVLISISFYAYEDDLLIIHGAPNGRYNCILCTKDGELIVRPDYKSPDEVEFVWLKLFLEWYHKEGKQYLH